MAARRGRERARAEIIIAKQRNGPTGKVHLAFLRELTRFENLLRQPAEEWKRK